MNKEEIVNLNDFEMRNVKGGSSYPCALSIIESAILTWELSNIGYDAGVDASWWGCPPPSPQLTDSTNGIWIDNEYTCMLPDLYVYGLNTNP